MPAGDPQAMPGVLQTPSTLGMFQVCRPSLKRPQAAAGTWGSPPRAAPPESRERRLPHAAPLGGLVMEKVLESTGMAASRVLGRGVVRGGRSAVRGAGAGRVLHPPHDGQGGGRGLQGAGTACSVQGSAGMRRWGPGLWGVSGMGGVSVQGGQLGNGGLPNGAAEVSSAGSPLCWDQYG